MAEHSLCHRCFLVILSLLLSPPTAAAPDPPNIVLIVIDDMGYHNLHGERAHCALNRTLTAQSLLISSRCLLLFGPPGLTAHTHTPSLPPSLRSPSAPRKQ